MEHKRIVVTRCGGPEVLEVRTETAPEPGPGQARVKVLAAGVSYGDVLARSGAVPDAPKPPFTPGFDVTGVVDSIGPGVDARTIGQRVTALLGAGGGYAEYVCIPAERLVPVPQGVDAVRCAGAVLNYFVAYQMLHRVVGVKVGQKILVHGAAGGVGTALVQLAARAGLDSYGTASTSKQELVADQGAIPIDYQRGDFLAEVRRHTGSGVDAAFDAIGGTHFLRSYRALRSGGHLVAYGAARAVRNGKPNRLTAFASFLSVKLLGVVPTARSSTFYTAGSLDKRQPDAYREDLTTVLNLLAQGRFPPW